MRIIPLLLMSVLAAANVVAQETPPERKDAAEPSSSLSLPVSFEKIRGALAQPAPAEPLKGLDSSDGSTTFRVNVTERQTIENVIATMKFEKPGPQVAGGNAYYEQFQRLFPPINNPLVQPYAAFSTGEAATLAAEALVEQYVAEKMAHVVGPAVRTQAERDAREEAARALAAYWAERIATTSESPSNSNADSALPKN